METAGKKGVQFKTNIKCRGCIATVTPFLNQSVGEGNWQVDTQNPDKVLSVSAKGITAETVKQAIQQAAFSISPDQDVTCWSIDRTT